MMPFTIIVIHRTPGQLPACLEAVRAFSDFESELYIVATAGAGGGPRSGPDNTGDGSLATPYTVRVSAGKNLVKACNAVLNSCRHPRVVFLDSGVIVTEHWLPVLADCLENAPGAGMIGPLTDGHFTGLSGAVFGPAGTKGSIASPGVAGLRQGPNRRIAVRRPPVQCLAAKTVTIRALGYLDETLVDPHAAQADLCLRAELAGLRNYLAGDAWVYADVQTQSDGGQKALRDKWESLDPESDLRRHYEALKLCHRATQAFFREEADQAVELFLKGIGLYPAEKRLYLDLAAMLADAGRYADALQTLAEMPDAGHGPDAQLIRALCQQGIGELDQARDTIERILAGDGQSAAGWRMKGNLLLEAGEYDRAAKAFRQSITCDPGFGPGYTALGNLEWSRGRYRQALDNLEQGIVLAPEVAAGATAYHAAISHLQAYSQATPVFSEAVAACRSSRQLRYLLIDVLLKAGRQEDAMAVIEWALADFGFQEGLLSAALAVREQLGPCRAETSGPSLSFCLIVRDEEADLPRCLQSIKPVADEIIVVDTGSQDRTRDIARVFGARVFDFEWIDDFAAAKNFATQQAEAQWIFSLDADEVLSARDHKALRDVIRGAESIPAAYAITTRNYLKVMDVVGWQPNDGCYPEEAGLGWIPSEKVRLFPNDRRVRFTYPVHEMVEPSLAAAGIPVLTCDIPVHHYGKLDYDRCRAKGKAYFKIGMRKLEAMQTSPTGIRELAIQAQTLGDNAEAVRLWEHLLMLESEQAPTYVNLASAYLELGRYDRAQAMAKKAGALDPELKESHFNLALSKVYAGDARAAAKILNTLLRREPDYPAAVFVLAAAQACAGEKTKALEQMKRLQCSDLAPGLPEALHSLAARLEKAGRIDYAHAVAGLNIGQ